MTEPVLDPPQDDPSEPTGPSAIVDDVDVTAAPDQWDTPDLSDLDGVE